MLLADGESWGWGALGTLVTAAALAVVYLLRNRSEIRTKEQKAAATLRDARRKTVLAEWQTVLTDCREELALVKAEVAHLRDQGERKDAVIEQLLEAAFRSIHECAALYEYARAMHRYAERKEGGQDPGPVPTLPTPEDVPPEKRPEFMLRQAATSAGLLRQVDEKVKPAAPAPGDPGPCSS